MALNILAATPTDCFILSPTIATTAISFSSDMGNMCPLAISAANCFSITPLAISASAFSTAKLMLFSDDACDISTTLMSLFAMAVNRRLAMPVTPTMPGPCTVSRLIFCIDEIPLIWLSGEPLGMASMSVPGRCGLNVFFILMGIPDL